MSSLGKNNCQYTHRWGRSEIFASEREAVLQLLRSQLSLATAPDPDRIRAEILTEILDPNRSVEANYRLWTATTRDGESFSGRLEGETQTSVEILDLTGQKHVIQRKDLTSVETSNLSIMPAGFESLPESDLSALLEYLAAGH